MLLSCFHSVGVRPRMKLGTNGKNDEPRPGETCGGLAIWSWWPEQMDTLKSWKLYKQIPPCENYLPGVYVPLPCKEL